MLYYIMERMYQNQRRNIIGGQLEEYTITGTFFSGSMRSPVGVIGEKQETTIKNKIRFVIT